MSTSSWVWTKRIFKSPVYYLHRMERSPELPRTSGYDAVPPRQLGSMTAVNYDGFFEKVEQAMRMHLESCDTPAEWNIRFCEDFPQSREGKFDDSFDVIMFRIFGVTPSGMSRDGVSRVPKGLMRAESRPHPTKSRYHLVREFARETVTVEFEILAKSNRQANRIVYWFHRFLLFYAHRMNFFRACGVKNFEFISREPDTKRSDFGQDLYSRILRYKFQLDLMFELEVKDLESIQVRVSPSDEGPVSEYVFRSDGQ